MWRPTIISLAAGVMAILGLTTSAPATAQTTPPRALTFLEAFKGSEESELRWPVAVAAASADEIAVADAYGPRVLRFRRVGVSWQLDSTAQLSAVPVGLGWDGNRYVASLRQDGGLVALEGPELLLRPLPLPRGVVPGPLTVLPNGDLLVYDYAGRRVVRLADGAELTAEAPIEGAVTALAATAAGGFLAAVAAQGAVLYFDANGELSATWHLPASGKIPAWPVGLAVEPGGDVVVVDRHAGRLLVLDATGRVVGLGSRKGWEPGLLLYPADLVRLPNGHLLVADEGNGRAQVFRRVD
ncbi:MAG: hypothetical protein WBH75_00950 [Thermoanaerobaculia bacterium]